MDDVIIIIIIIKEEEEKKSNQRSMGIRSAPCLRFFFRSCFCCVVVLSFNLNI